MIKKNIYEQGVLKKYSLSLSDNKLDEKDEIFLWNKYREGDESLREYFIIKYAPLVKYVAGKIAYNIPDSVEFDDLVSFGTFGLIDAIDKYDPTKGIKFKTYGITRIRGQIYDELRSLDWVPRSMRQKYKQIEEERRKYMEANNNETLSNEKIAEKLGYETSEVSKIVNFVSQSSIGSLDDAWIVGKDDNELSLLETVRSANKYNPHQIIENDEVRKTIVEKINLLPEKEKKVLVLYYYEELTLKEIGAVLDVTESRVSQLHTNAIRNIRNALEKIKKSLI